MLSLLRSIFRNLFRKDRVEMDLDQEINSYRELLIDRNIKEGMSRKEAMRVAEIALGGSEQVKEQVRQVRTGQWTTTVFQDFRFALRMLGKTPSFTAAALLTLALGIGANSAVFSVVNGVLLRDLPFDEPDRLVRVGATAGANLLMVTSIKDLSDWQAENHVFEGLAAFGHDRNSIAGSGGGEMIDSAAASPGFFELLRVRPLLGRTFIDGDKPGQRIGDANPAAGADGVVILGESFWKERFGGDPSAITRDIIVDGYPSTVVGVVPDRFGTLVGKPAIWHPWAIDPAEPRSSRHLPVLARLRPGVSRQQASGEMELIASRLRELYPEDNYNIGAAVISLQQSVVGDVA
ncbi:MAG TPA: ABC transporter permease, partial [Blastocatellia bacterium]